MLSEAIVQDLPPSSKLVLKILEYDNNLTQKEIVEKSRLAQRTTRDALERLQEADIVEKGVDFRDARQNIYTLTIEELPPAIESE